MIVNKYSNGGGGGTDVNQVKRIVNSAITEFSGELQEGDPIVGMASQLYSPDGTNSTGVFNYRTTAGDADVATGDAELRVIGGNSTYGSPTYNDSASLTRDGAEVEGFDATFYWGDATTWVSKNQDVFDEHLSKMRVLPTQGTRYVFQYKYSGGNNFIEPEAAINSSGKLARYGSSGYWTEVVEGYEYIYQNVINIKYENGYIISEWISEGSLYYAEAVRVNGYVTTFDVLEGAVIPNDIPMGESTYTYADATSAWTPSLPQALQNMQVGGVDYEPQEGDVITITRVLTKSASTHINPDKFVALGLNSFNKSGNSVISQFTENEGVYSVAIYAVAGLENGYVLYDSNSGITAVGISDAADGTMDTTGAVLGAVKSYVYPTAEKPYILITTTDIDKLCVHPAWSGYRDEEYENYSESYIDLSFLANYPLYSVGNVKDELDLVNGVLTHRIERQDYSAAAVDALIANGKVIGTDFDFDASYIYVVKASATTENVTISNYEYEANDFSVEYFTNNNAIVSQKVYAETWYMNNLVDKLRRMEMYFIHLDNLSSEGEVGKTYEYQGRLMQWVEGSGHTAEWLSNIANIDNTEGTGLIYSTIPDGQKLFEYKYSYGGEWRYVIYSGGTLYCTETGGTVVSSATIGQTFIFQTQSQSNYQVKGYFEKGHIGFIKNGYVSFQNVWDGNAANSHYELINKYNYPYTNVQSNGIETGIAKWNKYGQVVKKQGDISTKAIQFNTNASQYSSTGKISFYTDGINNGPDRIFVPTEGGTSGQVLVSNGDNAAPTFQSWIKVVKITSDAYDALVQAGTTDANTLYAIVDE